MGKLSKLVKWGVIAYPFVKKWMAKRNQKKRGTYPASRQR
ncbi:hypothetical protein ABMB67_003330 [Halalkalibacter oceani]